MAEISQKDQIALHEFSVQYRAAYAKKHPLSDLHLETIQDAIRGDYEREKEVKNDVSAEPSTPAKDKEPEPDEPEP